MPLSPGSTHGSCGTPAPATPRATPLGVPRGALTATGASRARGVPVSNGPASDVPKGAVRCDDRREA